MNKCKYYIVLFSLVMNFLSQSANGQINNIDSIFILNGHIKNHGETNFIYLVIYKYGNRVIDSCKIKNGNFKFKGYINGFTDKAYLKLTPKNSKNTDTLNNVQIFIENKKLKINLDYNKFSNFVLYGSEAYNHLKIFINRNTRVIKNLELNYNLHLKADDSIKEKKYYNAYKKLEALYHKNAIIYSSTLKNTSSLIPYLLFWGFNTQKNSKLFKVLKNKLSSTNKDSYYGRKLMSNLHEKESFEKFKGSFFPNLSGQKYSGNLVSFDSVFKNNQLTLINFWASWCIPCVEEISDIIKLNLDYNGIGFSVLMISNDTDRSLWINGIKKYSMLSLSHFLQSELLNNETGNKYNNELLISSLPTSFLIDNEGRVLFTYEGQRINEIIVNVKNYFIKK